MSKVKDLGVVYTPEEITKFLCIYTIFPYILDKINNHFSTEYEFRSNEEIEGLFLKMSSSELFYASELVKNIKILDPAVGIGYFLQESVRVLERLYKIFVSTKTIRCDITTIREWIITNNLYGVDISYEAVKECKKNLMSLIKKNNDHSIKYPKDIFNHIKTGNTLIGRISDSDPLFTEYLYGNLTPFHWDQKFPSIIEEGGFDIILGNPPWNILKPQEKEFFSNFNSRLTKYTVDKREANKIIKKLRENEDINSKWNNYKESIQNQAHFFKTTYRYQSGELEVNGKLKTISGDLNLYKLFIERIFHLLKIDGYTGIVVPSGIHTDAGTKGLRRLLFDSSTVRQLFCFENRKGIFPSIHKSFKFDLITFRKGGNTQDFDAFFMQKDQYVLQNIYDTTISINWELIKRISQSSWSILEFKTKKDIDIVNKMFQYPIISYNKPDELWKLQLTRELDITLDSDLFNSVEQGLVIYEGKMIEQYTHQFKKPRYWIKNDNIVSKFGEEYHDFKEYRLGFRSIAASTNRRTMVATILPKNICVGNSIIITKIFDSISGKRLIEESDLFFLCGIFNSFLFDYLLRLKVTTNINMFYIYEMPIPRLKRNSREYEEIVKNVSYLFSHYSEFESIKKEFNNSFFNSQKQNTTQIRAKIDAIVAKLYDLNLIELEYVLDQFHQRDLNKEKQLSVLKDEILIQFKKITTS